MLVPSGNAFAASANLISSLLAVILKRFFLWPFLCSSICVTEKQFYFPALLI